MKAILLAFAAAGTLVAAAVDVAWAQVVLASHRAIYDISLSTTSGATALESAEGRFVLELSDACDAYIFNQRFVVRWEYSEGEDVLQDDVLASWEAKTGTAFRFDSTSRVNGTLEEHYRGRAELEAAGQARSGRLQTTRHSRATVGVRHDVSERPCHAADFERAVGHATGHAEHL